MRKIFITCFCFFAAHLVQAGTWGAFNDWDSSLEPDSPPVSARNSTPVKQEKPSRVEHRYLLPSVLEGRSIRVYLSVPENQLDKVDDYQQRIRWAYNQWFSYPAQLIRELGREEEFADVLPILDRGMQVEFVDLPLEDKERLPEIVFTGQPFEKADIVFFLLAVREVLNVCQSAACYFWHREKGVTPAILVPSDVNWFKGALERVLLGNLQRKTSVVHEIGHSLGFADQYVGARSQRTHPVYSTEQPNKALMNVSDSLTCDDADGVINLIDRFLLNKGQGGLRGGEAGWRSLCKKSNNYYKGGAPLSKKLVYDLSVSEDQSEWVLREYRNGKLFSENTYYLKPNGSVYIGPKQETVLAQDEMGRPLRTRGADGETLYYVYVYETTQRIAIKGQQVVLVEYTNALTKKKGLRRHYIREKDVLFSNKNNISRLYSSQPVSDKGKPTGKKGFLLYTEAQKDKLVDIEISFNKKGEMDRLYVKNNPLAATSERSGAAVRGMDFLQGGYSKFSFPLSVEGDALQEVNSFLQVTETGFLIRRLTEWYLKKEFWGPAQSGQDSL